MRTWRSKWNGIQRQVVGGKWDYLDWVATMFGGVIGQALQIIIILYCFNIF